MNALIDPEAQPHADAAGAKVVRVAWMSGPHQCSDPNHRFHCDCQQEPGSDSAASGTRGAFAVSED